MEKNNKQEADDDESRIGSPRFSWNKDNGNAAILHLRH